MTSLCTQYYQLFLAQGLLIGVAMSFLFIPAVAIVSRRLAHRRGLALGIVIGGSSIGGVIWPIMLNQLLNHDDVSFGWSMRAVAFTMIPLLAVTCLTVVDVPKDKAVTGKHQTEEHGTKAAVGGDKPGNDSDMEATVSAPKPSSPAAPHRTDYSILKDRTYILLTVGLCLTYLGLFTPLFYISAYAVSQGISSSTSLYILAALNACSFFGRVIPGHLADYYGHYNIQVICILVAGIIGFCWTAATSLGGIIVWSLAYGFASGVSCLAEVSLKELSTNCLVSYQTVIALQSACAGKIATQHSQGAATGFLTGFISIPSVFGPIFLARQS